MAYANPLHPAFSNPEVAARVVEMVQDGAALIEPSFSVASESQAEVIYKDRRYLITPNDDSYKHYVAEMEGSGLRYVKNDSELSTQDLVVGEITRTARAIPQVLRSAQPRGGQTIREVFYAIGGTFNILAQQRNVGPKVGFVILQKMLILRGENEIMIAPPVEFEPISEESKQKLIEGMQSQLLPDYANFGGAALLKAFEQGLNNDTLRN